MIPYYYYEIGRLLLSECANDFAKPQEVMSILEDIKEVRKEKMIAQMRQIDPDTPVQFMSSVGSQELSQLRPALQEANAVINKMQQIKERAERQQEEGQDHQ